MRCPASEWGGYGGWRQWGNDCAPCCMMLQGECTQSNEAMFIAFNCVGTKVHRCTENPSPILPMRISTFFFSIELELNKTVHYHACT